MTTSTALIVYAIFSTAAIVVLFTYCLQMNYDITRQKHHITWLIAKLHHHASHWQECRDQDDINQGKVNSFLYLAGKTLENQITEFEKRSNG